MARLRTLRPALTALRPSLARAPETEADRFRRRDAEAPWRRWYKTARWQRFRLMILKRDLWTCRQTGVMLTGGRDLPHSAVVDHIVWHRGDAALFWDAENCQAVAKSWHDTEAQRRDRRRVDGRTRDRGG